ncbi:MAG: type II toxin-antitoxin system VapC family toxin [Inquilinus limosus]|uniref:Ribonuclease VapC n=1 Tax=Inquilinus limosus TaxID=171674 RepID=A0A952KE62_9PROT|nr:type II toxin-antitoxin system VapC family toxin [Inquilinus limosus]
MSFLLDTNVVSETRKRARALPAVMAWLASVPAAELYISAITILELDQGRLSVARRDPAQGELLRRWIEERVLTAFDGRILPVDLRVVRRCALLQVPDRRPVTDALIAATALVHGLTVVTRNAHDFEPMNVPVIDPWLTADKQT